METLSNLFITILLFVAIINYPSQTLAQANNEKAFAKGADIGWLPQMEATGFTFYNDKGKREDCMKILKDHGINTIRLRTWVNPSADSISGHCSKEETVAMAVRAKQWGMRILIDFHYSDS